MYQSHTNVLNAYKYTNHIQMYQSNTNLPVTYKCTNHMQKYESHTNVHITYKCTYHIQIYVSHTNIRITYKYTYHIKSTYHIKCTYHIQMYLARRLANPKNKLRNKEFRKKGVASIQCRAIVGQPAKRHSKAFGWWVDGGPFKLFTGDRHLVSPDRYACTKHVFDYDELQTFMAFV